MDQISVARIGLLHPAVRDSALRILEKAETVLTGPAKLRYAYTLRTFAEQAAIYAQGRITKGPIVTWAPAGYSYHNYGLAFDIVLIVNGKLASWDTLKDYDGDKVADWQEIVNTCVAEGWEWGGTWPQKKRDLPHFQKTFGLSVNTLLDRYNKKIFIPGTQYIQL